MASDDLKKDGYLNVDVAARNIVYHPHLNVILIFTKSGDVKVLDVNSGVILQSCHLSDPNSPLNGKYIAKQDKILLWDAKSLGYRGDYNGVLLLDTILQRPIGCPDQIVALELLLSEAILFLQTLRYLVDVGVSVCSDVIELLTERIQEAQANSKKGIKAQKWNIVCLDLKYSDFKLVALNTMVQLKKMERHIPGLAIASAINERLTDLMRSARYMDSLAAPDNNARYLMITEAARRETFVNWPHLDYKWALPDQMAQAGFYYNPNEPGDDRAMCFTCNVCLVSWEKNDEPWSEHERHSPVCPFVKGEYTENVPLAVTYSTCPAVESASSFNLVSHGEDGVIVCTAETPGSAFHVWSIERLLGERFSYDVTQEMHLLAANSRLVVSKGAAEEIPTSTSGPGGGANEVPSRVLETSVTALATFTYGVRKSQPVSKQNSAWNAENLLQTRICCAISTRPAEEKAVDASEAFLVVYTVVEKKEKEEQRLNKHKVDSMSSLNDLLCSSNAATGGVTPATLAEPQSTSPPPPPPATNPSEETKMDIVDLNLDDLKQKYNIKNEDRVRDCLMSMIRISDEDVAVPLNSNNVASELFTSSAATSNNSGNHKSATKSSNKITLNGISEEEENDLAMFPIWSSPPPTSGAKAVKMSLEDAKEELELKLKQKKKELMNLANEFGITLDVDNSPTAEKMGLLGSDDSSKLLAHQEKAAAAINFTCVPIQCISLASIAPDSYVISDVIPSHDQNYLLVVLKRRDPGVVKKGDGVELATEADQTEEGVQTEETFASTQLVLFKVDNSTGLLQLQPHCVQLLFEDSAPLSICMLPGYESDRKTAEAFETKDGVFAMACMDGSLKLVSLSTLRTISEASIDGEKFIAATYCKSLDRICGCTENGSLHFYSFYESDTESGDEHEDHNIPLASDESLDEEEHQHSGQRVHSATGGFREDATDARMKEGGLRRPPLLPNENVANFVAYKQELSLVDLKQAHQLTQFYSLLFPYTGEVPVCWNELIVQKVRRQSQLLKPGEDVHLSKTWRLHRDATTWDEHLIELTLPLSVSLGHIDFKYRFYQPCEDPPKIQVTLLKQFSSGFGYRMKTPTSGESRTFVSSPAPGMSTEEDNIDFGMNADEAKANMENPVLSVEYLHNHNAEILAGPIELSSCMDLTEQNGTVVLTSPKLFRTRGRNYLIHIKTMTDPTKEDSHGCDWLHEISINVRRVAPVTNNKIADDRAQRCAILENNSFLGSLFRIACQPESVQMQNLALDLIHWIVSIRMTRFRAPKTSENTYPDVHALQKECVRIASGFLSQFMLQCFLGGNRSVAHKCTKILLIMDDGVGNLRTSGVEYNGTPDSVQCLALVETFQESLKVATLACLDRIKDVRFAGSLRWLNVLICGTSSVRTYPEVAAKVLELLAGTSMEMDRRYNPYLSLLRARFGLYGLPFEMEMFDVEMPRPNNKAAAHPGTLANIVKTATSVVTGGAPPVPEGKTSSGGGTSSSSASLTDALETKYLPINLKRRAVGHQMKGLLEVTILHYICVDASEATRLESVEATGQFVGRTTLVDDITFDQPAMGNGSVTVSEASQMKSHFGGSLSKCDIDMLTVTKDAIYNAVNYLKEKNQDTNFSLSDEESTYSDCEQMISLAVQQQQEEATMDTAAEDALPAAQSNVVLPWHKLLSPIDLQLMVIERMHPGAKRHVTLDFGMPVMLTDVVIPACEDLISIVIDIWCLDEDVDGCRLTTCTDIGTKPLIVSDLQPAPVCRYLKVTVTGKYGMSATRCKVPIGAFYGHQIVVDSECYDVSAVYRLMRKSSKGGNGPGVININDQLGALHAFFEDVHCRYNLACSKLMDQLDPLLKSDASNLAHLQTYFCRTKDTDDTMADHAKIVASYEECMLLQQQLNVIRNVIKRLEEAADVKRSEKPAGLKPVEERPLSGISTDKLRVLNEVFVESLLYFIVEHDLKAPVSEMTSLLTQEKCTELFHTLILSMDIHVQLATCTMLVKMCGLQVWWGDFLATVLSTMFSSENVKIFPQDRVFLLLTYMGRKSIAMGANRSLVIDHVLRSLAQHLMPLSKVGGGVPRPMWAKTDLQHISWLLLFLSVCLDDGNAPGGDRKEYQSSRWDFMTGESDLVKNRNQSNSKQMMCRSFKKRMMNSKYNPPSASDKMYVMQTAESMPVSNMSSQFELAIKQELAPKETALKKAVQNSMKPFFDCIVDLSAKQKLKMYKYPTSGGASSGLGGSGNGSSAGASLLKPRASSALGGVGKSSSGYSKQYSPDGSDAAAAAARRLLVLKPQNTILVVRALVQLLLSIGPACNMDLFLLTCKVFAQLVSTCSGSIRMSMIMDWTQLGDLIRMTIWRERHQPWVVLALTCLFQDIIEADKSYKGRDESAEGSPSGSGASSTPSSGSASSSGSSVSVNKSDSLMMIPDLMEDSSKETKTMFINNIMSMLENRKTSEHRELKRDFIKAKGIFPSRNDGNVICRNISNAIDSRLEYGLDTNVEMRTKRLSLISYLNLFSNLYSPGGVAIGEQQYDAVDGLCDWPENIVKAWSADSPGMSRSPVDSARRMLVFVFSDLFEMLHYQQQPWLFLEPTMHLYLVLNGQFGDKPALTAGTVTGSVNGSGPVAGSSKSTLTGGSGGTGSGIGNGSSASSGLHNPWVASIPLTTAGINGLLVAIGMNGSLRIKTWCLAFQTLITQCEKAEASELGNEIGVSLAQNIPTVAEIIAKVIELDMFFSGDGISTADVDVKQCVGPTVCKLVQRFLRVLHVQWNPLPGWDPRPKYMQVLLNLIENNGAIVRHTGPIDAQNELIKELLSYDYTELVLDTSSTTLRLVKAVTKLVFNHANRKEWVFCHKAADTKNYNIFNSIYTTVFGSEAESSIVSHDVLLVNLLKLAQKVVAAKPQEDAEAIAQSVVQSSQTIHLLLSSLMNCSSSSFELLLAEDTKGEFKLPFEEHMTVSGAFFQFVMLVSKRAQPVDLIKAIITFLSNRLSFRVSSFHSFISESFLWYLLSILNTPENVLEFTQQGGIKMLCDFIVGGQRYLLNMHPGMISMIMQFLTKSPIPNAMQGGSGGSGVGGTKKPVPVIPSTTSSLSATAAGLKGTDGLINFAPFCTISSDTSRLQQTEVLIQAPVASHRRARTAAWNYLFYQNQSYVDLTITFPTAVLVKEVQLLPHFPSLASCPFAVAVELTRDSGLPPMPMSQPMSTVGLTCIKLTFAEAEIATSMVLRLYRPRDSSTIGLTQISIFGTNTFSDVNKMNAFQEQQEDEENLVKCNMAWLKVLERCFTVAAVDPENDLSPAVIQAAANYQQFLETSCAMLNTTQTSLATVQYVVLKMGLFSKEVGLKLIGNLLRDSIPHPFKLYNDTLSDLLFDLCTNSDEFTRDRIGAVLKWVEEMNEEETEESRLLRATNRYCGFVKCIASVLWTAHTTGLVNNLEALITERLFDAVFEWTTVLVEKDPFRESIDSMLCSICAIRPELFQNLLVRMGIRPAETNMSDDRKATIEEEEENNPTLGVAGEETLLARDQLLTLAMSCQSKLAVQQLIDSGFPGKMAKYVGQVFQRADDPVDEEATIDQMEVDDEMMVDVEEHQQQEETGDNGEVTGLLQAKDVLNCRNIIDFFSEVCAEGLMRDWLGSPSGSCFWAPLLYRLCHARLLNDRHEIETQLTELEMATIRFLSKVTTCHPENQQLVTRILIEVIRQPEQVLTDQNLGNRQAISGFTRRLILDLLLENEKILVAVQSQVQVAKKEQGVQLSGHPSKRPNAHNVYLMLSTNAKVMDILESCRPVFTSFFGPGGERGAAGGLLGATGSVDEAMVLGKEDKFLNGVLDELSMGISESGLGGAVGGAGGMGEDGKASGYWKSFTNSLLDMDQTPELMSMVAGVTAKDKRLKDVKNHAAVLKAKESLGPLRADESLVAFGLNQGVNLVHPLCPNAVITPDTSIAQILAMLQSNGHSLSTPCVQLNLCQNATATSAGDLVEGMEVADGEISGGRPSVNACDFEPIACPLQIFSNHGGLSLLALPTVYPDTQKSSAASVVGNMQDRDKSPGISEWVKIEPSDEIYEDLDDTTSDQNSKSPVATTVPMYSLSAFGLFLKLPPYSDVLLRDKFRAQCLLRLVLGVTGDGEGNEICSTSVAATLPTLPFEVFRQLLDRSMLTTDDGMKLRHMVIEVGAVQLVLRCLSIFTHQNGNGKIGSAEGGAPGAAAAEAFQKPTAPANGGTYEKLAAEAKGIGSGSSATAGIPIGLLGPITNNPTDDALTTEDKSHMYWAKGTGFGTGSTQQSWDVEQSMMKQKSEEEQVTVLLQILSSYLNPGDQRDTFVDLSVDLPQVFYELMQKSCLIPVLCSYLRNDSVLDITRHIPLYRSILLLLRAVALSSRMVTLLVPRRIEGTLIAIVTLLANMKSCVDTYAKRLKVSKKSNIKGQTQRIVVSLDDGDDEGLALLIPDIQETFEIVEQATSDGQLAVALVEEGMDEEMRMERPLEVRSLDQRYVEIMKKLQFDTYEMMAETDNGYRFTVTYNFERNAKVSADRGLPARVKRLAQETVTLSTSLPLSYSSTVFVRCDADRLDVMKVLITGPVETPYANGCFEFDVFFPPDYPNSPMLINLETTGRHTVRFNPNLYNDGKVCLSVLNTWHGRPEEKWNPHTSSFLQVLVSIQSLILVPEPYFNEPGFERSRGTPTGTMSSLGYNSNIYQACVRWAMLEQIRNPNPVFKEVIHMHFWLKRHEICAQIEGWIADLAKLQLTERVDRSMVLRRQYRQLREELAKLPIPPGLEDLNQPFSAAVQGSSTGGVAASSGGSTTSELTATPSATSLASTTSDTSTQSMGSDNSVFVNITQLNPTETNSFDMENHGLG